MERGFQHFTLLQGVLPYKVGGNIDKLLGIPVGVIQIKDFGVAPALFKIRK